MFHITLKEETFCISILLKLISFKGQLFFSRRLFDLWFYFLKNFCINLWFFFPPQPNLVASYRTFVTEANVIELTDTISGRNDHLTLYVFNDVLEVGWKTLLKSYGRLFICYKTLLNIDHTLLNKWRIIQRLHTRKKLG